MGLPGNLEYLQLRVGTNGSPTPFFHPTLEFNRYAKLRSLSIIEVTDLEALNSVGNALFLTEQLSELTISANTDSRLSLGDIFASWTGPKSLDLNTLDLRGFANLGSPAASIWESITPFHLAELTLDIGASDRPLEDYGEFWEAAAEACVELTRLETNLITGGLTRFICSFSGLKMLLLMPCLLTSHVFRPLSPLLHTVAIEHSSSLRVLSIHPQGVDETEYLLDRRMLMALTASCTQLQEIAFGILGQELVRARAHLAITILLRLP
jgi:hypothetical protein